MPCWVMRREDRSPTSVDPGPRSPDAPRRLVMVGRHRLRGIMGQRVVMTNDLLEAALGYAERGWTVFPLNPGGKTPLGKPAPHWREDASTDPEVIRAWWTAEPEGNIGLPTGGAFDVLDVDGPEALERLEVWSVDRPGDDVEGPTVATPRGWHGYVAPTGRGNAVNLGGLAGIDWRGRGGYVVAPPSVKEDGGTWSWMAGTPQDLGPDTPIIPAPDWVLQLFDRRTGPVVGTLPRHAGRTGYGAAALERELGRLATATEGTRNHQLNASAYSMGRLVGARALDAEETGQALLRVAMGLGLGEHEATATIRSGMTSGIRSPREVAS
jgi:hypothetical protein